MGTLSQGNNKSGADGAQSNPSRRDALAALGAAMGALFVPGCSESTANGGNNSSTSLRGRTDLSIIYSLKELTDLKRSPAKGMLVKLDVTGAILKLKDPVATVNESGRFFKFGYQLREGTRPLLLVADSKDFTVTPETVVLVQNGALAAGAFLDARTASVEARMKEVGLKTAGKENNE